MPFYQLSIESTGDIEGLLLCSSTVAFGESDFRKSSLYTLRCYPNEASHCRQDRSTSPPSWTTRTKLSSTKAFAISAQSYYPIREFAVLGLVVITQYHDHVALD